jgi:hypothetical protein
MSYPQSHTPNVAFRYPKDPGGRTASLHEKPVSGPFACSVFALSENCPDLCS